MKEGSLSVSNLLSHNLEKQVNISQFSTTIRKPHINFCLNKHFKYRITKQRERQASYLRCEKFRQWPTNPVSIFPPPVKKQKNIY